MSAHLMMEAAYLDIPADLKLTLMYVCAAADENSKLAWHSLSGAAIWASTDLDGTEALLQELERRGYLHLIEPANDRLNDLALHRVTVPHSCEGAGRS